MVDVKFVFNFKDLLPKQKTPRRWGIILLYNNHKLKRIN